ncbi:MAG: hypothetical protein U1E67_14320 [Hyphomicrobiales bacterium]
MSAKQPSELTARLLLTFTSKAWCEDMGASLVVTLKSSGLDMMPLACAQDPDGTNWHGELRMPVSLAAVFEGEDTGDLASIVVKPVASSPGSLSVILRLDTPRLTAAREKLLSLPAAQDSDDARVFGLSFTFMLRNDTTKPALLSVDATTTESDATLAIPPGGTRSITLSQPGVDKLLHEQAIEAFSLRYDTE